MGYSLQEEWAYHPRNIHRRLLRPLNAGPHCRIPSQLDRWAPSRPRYPAMPHPSTRNAYFIKLLSEMPSMVYFEIGASGSAYQMCEKFIDAARCESSKKAWTPGRQGRVHPGWKFSSGTPQVVRGCRESSMPRAYCDPGPCHACPQVGFGREKPDQKRKSLKR
jgi:hypothetical protein